MTNTRIPLEPSTDELGQFFSNQLSLATAQLPHDISERLRVARHMAMAQRQPVVQLRRAQNDQRNSQGTLTASGDEGLNLWSVLASSVPLLALVLGLVAIQWTQDDTIALEIAATDSALLTDELPPAAYADAGFAQFLKLHHGSASHD